MLAFVGGTLNVHRYFTLSCRLSDYNLAGQVPSTCYSQFASSGLDTSICEPAAIHSDGDVLFGLHVNCWLFTL